MNRMSAKAFALSLVVVGVLVATSCSDGGGSSSSTSTTLSTPTIPSSSGDGCEDPTGDISDVAGNSVTEGSLTEPAGIDLVSASATVNGQNLDVVYETAAPIDAVPNAEFYLAQGTAQTPTAFEVRATREALGAWTMTFISWDSGNEVRSPMTLKPTVEGNTLRYSLPLDVLKSKPIANYLAFGASAEVADGVDADSDPDVVFDECSSLSPPSSDESTPGTAG